MKTFVKIAAAALSAASLYAAEPTLSVGREHAPMIVHERHGTAVSSTNWSGYAVTGADGSVTDVEASWIVPAIAGTCTSTNEYSSFWVGIDGYSSNTVEQIGTDSDCQGGKAVYYAWYEFYPHFSYNINNFTVKPGDNISAAVHYAAGKFTVVITNVSTGKSFSTFGKVASAKRSSAEWIAEAPYSGGILPLADFGSVGFGLANTSIANTCFATISNVSGAIGSFANWSEITMTDSSGVIKAQPTVLSPDKGSFSDNWHASQ